MSRDKSRILLYVFYDRDGIIDDYVVYQLEQMRTQVDKIVMICQGGVRDDNLAKAKALADQVLCRENKGYDAGAWQDAIINHVGWDEIEKYEDLILMNDSCYGPIFPIEEMFRDMDVKDVDFWGITRHGEAPNAYKLNPYGYIPMHIQSYFTCYRKNMHTGEVFRKYWNELPEITKFEESVSYFETVITKVMEDAGYKWDVYMDGSLEERPNRKCFNPTVFLADKLLIEQRNPFIKKKTLLDMMDQYLLRTDASISPRCMKYIEESTAYDADMIHKNLLRLGNVRTLYEMYHLDYFLPEYAVKIEATGHKKIALVMHLFYEELLDYCYEYASNMPEYADIYITVADEGKKAKIEQLFSGLKCNKLEIRLVDNRGMDVAGLLVGARDVFLKDYDYVCYIHDKMSYRDSNPRSGEGFRDNMFHCMLESSAYIENIIGQFERNRYLGLLVPPYPLAGQYIKTIADVWQGNEEGALELAEKLGLNCNIDKSKDPVAVGTTFWCRPRALKKLMEYPWEHTDFAENSDRHEGDLLHTVERIFEYVAQDQGYYTGVVMPIEHAQLVYSVTNYLMNKNVRSNRKIRAKYKKLKKSNDVLKSSSSLKIGRIITAIPRKLKGKH